MSERPAQNKATPSLARVMKETVNAKLLETKNMLPGVIVKYDYKTQKADVQPTLKMKSIDGTVFEMPVIYNVPVAHPRAGDAFIHMPLKKGNNVMLIFSDRSLDNWLSSGGVVDPKDSRMHHLSDAVAYPGLYPFNEPLSLNNGNDIIIKNKSGGSFLEVRIKKNNHIQIKNGRHDLLKVLSDFMLHVKQAQTITALGLQTLQHPLFAADVLAVNTFLEV